MPGSRFRAAEQSENPLIRRPAIRPSRSAREGPGTPQAVVCIDGIRIAIVEIDRRSEMRIVRLHPGRPVETDPGLRLIGLVLIGCASVK